MNKNEVIKVNFDQGQQNLIRVSREFELSELKWLKSRVKSKGNGTLFELAESSSYPSSSYRGPTVFIFLAPVVQTLDSAIQRINHYPADNAIVSRNTYPLDSDLSGG